MARECGSECVSLSSDAYYCAYDSCTVDDTYDSGTHTQCCDQNQSCQSFWGTDINGNPVQHFYCG